MNSLRTFRWIAVAEATSFLALLVATYFKRTGDSELGVTILGPIHGVLFLIYGLLTLMLRTERGWGMRTTVLVLAGAVFPFGGYVVDWWLAKESPDSPEESKL